MSRKKAQKAQMKNFVPFLPFCGYSLRGVQGATRPRAGLSPPE